MSHTRKKSLTMPGWSLLITTLSIDHSPCQLEHAHTYSRCHTNSRDIPPKRIVWLSPLALQIQPQEFFHIHSYCRFSFLYLVDPSYCCHLYPSWFLESTFREVDDSFLSNSTLIFQDQIIILGDFPLIRHPQVAQWESISPTNVMNILNVRHQQFI